MNQSQIEHYVAITSAVLTLLPLVLRLFKLHEKPWAERVMAAGNDLLGAMKKAPK